MKFNDFIPVRKKKIGVAAPASFAEKKLIESGLSVLVNMGFEIDFEEPVPGKIKYLAGTDHHRAEKLSNLFAKPELEAIICVRGGYGSLRTAAHLDFEMLAGQKKVLVGFSDITVLLCGLLRAGLRSVHGPGITSLPEESEVSLTRLNKILAGNWSDVSPLKGSMLAGVDKAEGYLVGGNLTILSHLVGTPWQPPTENGIIFFEDVNEPLYRIDRCLTHLISSGFFIGCKGVAAGRLDGVDKEKAKELIAERLSGLKVPVIADLPFGHKADNMALLVGGRAVIDPIDSILSPCEEID